MFIPSIHGQSGVFKRDVLPATVQMSKVIQMGNLLGVTEQASDHDNDDSDYLGCNHELARLMYEERLNNDKFEFLIGANEMLILNAPGHGIARPETTSALRAAWFLGDNPKLKVATVANNRLVTSCGLTYGLWRQLGSPETAFDAMCLLNTLYNKVLYPGECLALGDAPNFAANPIFANLFLEVLPSWITADEACPFDQITGSCALNSVVGQRFLNDRNQLIHYLDSVVLRNFGSIAYIKGAKFMSLDLQLPIEKVAHIPEPGQILVERKDY